MPFGYPYGQPPSYEDDLAALTGQPAGSLGTAAPTGLQTLEYTPTGPLEPTPPAALPTADIGVAPAPTGPAQQPLSGSFQPSAQPTSTRSSSGRSESIAGTDLGQLQRIQSFMGPQDDKATRALAQREDAALAGDTALTAAARNEQAGAVAGETDVRRKIADAQAEGSRQVALFQQETAKEEQQLAAAGQLKIAQAEGQYRQSLAAADQLARSFSKDRWFRDKGTAGKVAAWGAALAAGILDAKGVKNSIIPQMNTEIDRDIQEQLTAIEQGRKTSEGFQALYQMARQDESDAGAVREKLRGMYLQGMKAWTEAEVQKYGSDLADAQGATAIAALDKQMADTMIGLRDRHETRFRAGIDQYLTKRRDDMNAANQRRSLAIQEMEAQGRMAASAAAGNAAAMKTAVPIVQWKKNPDGEWVRDQVKMVNTFSEKQADELRDRQAATISLARKVKEYQDLIGDKSIYDGPGAKYVNKEGERRIKVLRGEIVADYVRSVSGASTTDAERKTLAEQFPMNGWTTRGGIGSILDDKIQRSVDKYRDDLSTMAQGGEDAGFGELQLAEVTGRRQSAEKQKAYDALPANQKIKAAVPAGFEKPPARDGLPGGAEPGVILPAGTDASGYVTQADLRSLPEGVKSEDAANYAHPTFSTAPASFKRFVDEAGIDTSRPLPVDLATLRGLDRLANTRGAEFNVEGGKVTEAEPLTPQQKADIEDGIALVADRAGDPIVRRYAEWLRSNGKSENQNADEDLAALHELSGTN